MIYNFLNRNDLSFFLRKKGGRGGYMIGRGNDIGFSLDSVYISFLGFWVSGSWVG